MGGGENEVSEASRRRSDQRTGEAAAEGRALDRRQEGSFAEVIGFLMEAMRTPLINDLLVAQQQRDASAAIAGAEEGLLDDVLAKFSKGGRGRDARADAVSRRVRLQGADQRTRAMTDLLVNQQVTNRNASLSTINELLKTLQLQQQPTFQTMAALSGGATAQANIAAANAIHNGGADLGGFGELLGALPGLGTFLGDGPNGLRII